jgi:hypothetical protein
VGSSAFFDYVVSDTIAGALRAGVVMCVWGSGIITYTDTSTADLGSTTAPIEFSVENISGTISLYANITSGTWTVKVGTRIL